MSYSKSYFYNRKINILKWIGVISMMIDHLAASHILNQWGMEYLYVPFKAVGRLAFPIFGFLLVYNCHKYTADYEGFRRALQYTKRLVVTSIIAFAPYQILFSVNRSDNLFNFIFDIPFNMLVSFSGISLILINVRYFKFIYDKKIKIIWFPFVLMILLGIISLSDYGLLGMMYCFSVYLLLVSSDFIRWGKFYRDAINKSSMTMAVIFLFFCNFHINYAYISILNGLIAGITFVVVCLLLTQTDLNSNMHYLASRCILCNKIRRYFFYIFYPMHLAILVLLKYI